MRDIKFRMWDKQANKFFTDQDTVFQCLRQQIIGLYDHNANGSVFEQYTGLKDKNGNEIYEGDIISFNLQDYNGVDHFFTLPVEYHDSVFSCNKESKIVWTDDVNVYLLDIVCDDDEVEIVGNIHENPELLKAE